MITNSSLVSIANLSREKILYLMEMAHEFELRPNRKLLDGRIVATFFFEPSTRTRLSFETAAQRLGARVIGCTAPRELTPVPGGNAGEGAHQHASQTLLDLYTMMQTQGTLDNLHIHLVGDLKYGRTVHSLIMAMRHFNPTFHFIAPAELAMPEEYKQYCREHGIHFVEHENFDEEVIAEADILYMTRVQRERFSDLMEYERVKDVYILRREMLAKARRNLRILHPLPRVNEIAQDVDDTPYAYYFEQARNGLFAREAIICDVLGITLDEVRAASAVLSQTSAL